MSWHFRSKPIVRIPEQFLQPYVPIGYIMSWPTGVSGKNLAPDMFSFLLDAHFIVKCLSYTQSLIRFAQSLPVRRCGVETPSCIVSLHFLTSLSLFIWFDTQEASESFHGSASRSELGTNWFNSSSDQSLCIISCLIDFHVFRHVSTIKSHKFSRHRSVLLFSRPTDRWLVSWCR